MKDEKRRNFTFIFTFTRKQNGLSLTITITFHKWWAMLFVLTPDFWCDYNHEVSTYHSTNAYCHPGSRLTKSSVTDAGDNYTITVEGESDE